MTRVADAGNTADRLLCGGQAAAKRCTEWQKEEKERHRRLRTEGVIDEEA